MTPGDDSLWFLPLGGTGEIGMNLNVYGHAGRWLVVDCGVTFGRDDEPGPKIQMADPAFLVERRSQIDALVLTHAHEDHVGAVAHLWPLLRCPVHATDFTAAVLRRKLAEKGLLDDVEIIETRPHTRRQIGAFDVSWVPITHSIPEAHGLLLRTPAGVVFHTGDWKLDPDPVVGARYDEAAFRAIGDAGVDAMVCDSTNATTPGRSVSEARLRAGLGERVREARGRVIVTTFGSNLARLHTLAAVAADSGRYWALLGRSLLNMAAAARASGHWHPARDVIAAAELGWLPREEVLAVATGSQGDPGAALDRLSRDAHPDLDLVEGDTVIFSSRVIPGNEEAIERISRRLKRKGVLLVTDEDCAEGQPIHASGHPPREELRDMYRWIRPQVAVPTHGTPAHLQAHAELAREEGVPRALCGLNGDLFMLTPNPGLRRGAVTAARLGVDDRDRDGTLQPLPAPDYERLEGEAPADAGI